MHRGKVDPGVSELPWGNELSRDHVNRPLMAIFQVFNQISEEKCIIWDSPARVITALLENFSVFTNYYQHFESLW